MELQQNRDVQTEWESLAIEGKGLFKLRDNELLLCDSHNRNERVVAILTIENCKETFNELIKQFEDAQKQFSQIEEEWNRLEDKTQLLTSVRRYRNFINKLNGIGDFNTIWNPLEIMESTLKSTLAENYNIRLNIVQKAETLKEALELKADDWNILLEKWKHAPMIEKEQNDLLWARLEAARSSFYEHKQELVEERNRELMQNLDWKMEVCEQAENWADSENWQEGTEAFKGLFERWKDIGHVPSIEKNNELWERFRAAKDKFFSRKAAHFEQINSEREANYQLKLGLVEEAEQIKNSTNWHETAEQLNKIMIRWKEIGKVPFEKSEELWTRLQAARDCFYNARRQNMNEIKEKLQEHLAIKEKLADRAQAIKDSTDWEGGTKEMNQLMVDWKKAGAIPKDQSDAVWERFLAARKHFFARKDADREKRKATFFKKLNGRLEQTKQFLEKLRAEHEEDRLNLEDFQQSLKDTTGTTSRDNELRTHLSGLISTLEKRMPSRIEKIAEVEKQLATLHESLHKSEHTQQEKAGSKESRRPGTTED